MNVQPGFPPVGAEPSDDAESRIWLAARRRRTVLIAAVIAAVALAALLGYLVFGKAKPVATAAQQPHVTVIRPGHESVSISISATGSLAARREMPVGVAGEGGMVTQVLVDAGDWVGAGQTLAIIERSVQAQQANQLAAQIRAARADADLAQAQLDRAAKLVDRGFVSRADIDQKTATRDAARARVGVAQAQLGEIQARIGQLAIRSPAAGLVLSRNLEPGQVVGSGSGALFRVAKGGEMELKAQVAEQDLARLKTGLPAQVTPVGSAKSFTGSIWLLSPIIDPQTRQGEARIALSYDPALRPGGFAAARITSGAVDAPLLPESAVLSDDQGNFVYIVGQDKKVARRVVKTGGVTNAGISILSGLTGREDVVLSAGAFLSPGDEVIPERKSAAR